MKDRLLTWEGRYPVAVFLGLSLLIAWPLIVLSGYSLAGGLGEGLASQIFGLVLPVLIAQFSPSIAAFLLVGLRFGRAGLRDLLVRAWQVPTNKGWIAVAVLLPVAVVLVAVALLLAMGLLPAPDLAESPAWLALPLYLAFLLAGILFGGISEEFGWRGYLLPILQRRHTALVSALIVGILWAIWHLEPDPAMKLLFTDGWSAFLPRVSRVYALYLISATASSIYMAWIFNHTGGSLLPIILTHSSSNAVQTLITTVWEDVPIPAELLYYGVWWVVAIALILWQGSQHLNRRRERWMGEDRLLPPIQ